MTDQANTAPICPHCRSLRRPGAEFCYRCGRPLPPLRIGGSRGNRPLEPADEDLPPVEVPPLPSAKRRQRLLTHPLVIGMAILAVMSTTAALTLRNWHLPLAILGVGVLVAVVMVVWELLE